MSKIFDKRKFGVLIFTTCFFIITLPVLAQPNLQDAFKPDGPLHTAADKAGYKPVDDVSVTTEQLIGDVIKMLLSFLGIIFLFLMIYGGYMWMLARGNEQQVEKAKNLIVAAIIGAIIVLSAYVISGFILEKIGDTTIQNE